MNDNLKQGGIIMRKAKILIITLSAALALAACKKTTVEDSAQLKRQVEEATEAYWQTMLAGDYDKLPSFYTDDAVLMPHGNETMGVEGMIEQQNQGKEMGISVNSYIPTALEVWGYGDLIYEVGTYEMETSMEGMPMSKGDHGSYMCVWQKAADDSLKRKYFIWNSAVVEQPAAAPAASLGEQPAAGQILPFEGNWELVSTTGEYPDGNGGRVKSSFEKDPDNFHMKLIHDNYFMFAGQETVDGDASASYGYGTYTLEDNVYTEHILFHVGEDAIGTSPSFEMTVDGDTLIQKGPLKIGDFKDVDWGITETYERK